MAADVRDPWYRDPARIPQLLALVEMQWRLNPQLRLGQLIVNAVSAAGGSDVRGIEDDVLIAHFRKQYNITDELMSLLTTRL